MDHRKICFIQWGRQKTRGITGRCLCSYSGQFSWLTFQVLPPQWLSPELNIRDWSQTLENVIGYWCRKKLSLAPAFWLSLALESSRIPHLNSYMLKCDGWNVGLEESPQLCFPNSYNAWTIPKIPSPFKTIMFPCYLHSELLSLLFMLLMFGLNFCSPLFLSINFIF